MAFACEQARKWCMAAGLRHPNPYERAQFLWQAMDGPARKPDEKHYISFNDLIEHFRVFREA